MGYSYKIKQTILLFAICMVISFQDKSTQAINMDVNQKVVEAPQIPEGENNKEEIPKSDSEKTGKPDAEKKSPLRNFKIKQALFKDEKYASLTQW